MRSYPQNSPSASARIVAVAMLADGNLCIKEFEAFDRLDAYEQLGLNKTEFQAVVQTFCNDIFATAYGGWSGSRRIEPEKMAELMSEIDAPELQRKLSSICMTVFEADGHSAEGESVVLAAMAKHWGMLHTVGKMGGLHD